MLGDFSVFTVKEITIRCCAPVCCKMTVQALLQGYASLIISSTGFIAQCISLIGWELCQSVFEFYLTQVLQTRLVKQNNDVKIYTLESIQAFLIHCTWYKAMRLLARGFKKWSGNRKYFMLLKLHMYKPLNGTHPGSEVVESIWVNSTWTRIQAEADLLTLHTLKQRQTKHALWDLLSLKFKLCTMPKCNIKETYIESSLCLISIYQMDSHLNKKWIIFRWMNGVVLASAWERSALKTDGTPN